MPQIIIEDITWFPDYPDRNIPPNEYITVAYVTVRNIGNDGYANIRLYAVENNNWVLKKTEAFWLPRQGRAVNRPIKFRTPSYGIWHVAITAFGTDENEPSLPDPSQCP